jgi:hypothetical protein
MIIKRNYYFKNRKLPKTCLSKHPLHIKGSVNSKNTGWKLNRFMKTATTHSEDTSEFINKTLDCPHQQTCYVMISLQNQLYTHHMYSSHFVNSPVVDIGKIQLVCIKFALQNNYHMMQSTYNIKILHHVVSICGMCTNIVMPNIVYCMKH